MAKNSSNKRKVNKAYRAAETAARKNPKAFWAALAIVLVVVLIVGAIGYWLYKTGRLDDWLHREGAGEVAAGEKKEIANGDLSIHFLYLGNKYAGDCTLIKVGDTEVLIDAGSRQGSAGTIVPYIEEYCTDGVLEYVVATHADQDHIAAFVGTKEAKGVFESFECKTIIDFPLTNKSTSILNSYYEKRDAEVAAGAKHYSALQCWKEEDGAKKSYALSENVTMSILYNYYYENKSSDENNYSVCILLSQKDGENVFHYLFTGDLEEKGEEYLVQYNSLPKVKLFKAGHHGSPTSSNDCLLSVIQPEIVCVCCCAGSTEYTLNKDNTFPSQAMIDRVGKYTKNIYVTTRITSDGHAPMNGNIVFYYGKKEEETKKSLKLWCSENTTLLKDTEWFAQNRVWNGVA
ncbi:MAG: MBL fold metallo-hydrolase [Clostridia bacterium]|jgi:competence protein ComEC|nr:MBL fold metallo-hydrolase [Clostridia bacterium]